MAVGLLGLALLAGCDPAPTPSVVPVPSPGPSEATESFPSAPPEVAFRWASPKDGAKVSKRRLTLRAAPDVAGTSDGARVTFSIDWPGDPRHEACVATKPTDAGAWECDVDLAALQAPAGSLKFDFDVEAQAGTVDESPDGKRTVEYRPPKPTWRPARQVLPKGCYGPALTVDEASVYHVAATCDGAIGYASGSGGRAAARMFKSPGDRIDLGPELAVDDNTLYLAFTRYRPQNEADTCGGEGPFYLNVGVYVRSRTLPDGAWSAPRQIGRPEDVLYGFRVRDGTIHATVLNRRGANRYERITASTEDRVPIRRVDGTSLRVGDDGKARMAYVDWKDGAIKVATVDGLDVTSTVVSDGGILRNPLLALGPGNQPHVVWTRYKSEDGGCGGSTLLDAQGTYYGTLRNGTWTSERITKATGLASFALDPETGAVDVLVNGNSDSGSRGRLTHYERASGGGWTATPLRTPVGGGVVIRRDAADGSLVVAYGDGGIRVMTRR